MAQTKRQRYQILRSQLELDRSSFMSTWRDLNDYILPRRARFLVTDTNRGERRNTRILDSTATLANRTLQSGMMSGITSPAREWKRLTTPDPSLSEYGPVKEWLDVVNKRMSAIFTRSNLYQILPLSYGDMGAFGIAGIFQEEDFDDVTRFYSLPIGSYKIAVDERGRVNVLFREFRMKVRQLVSKFGKKANGDIDWSKISIHVKNLWDAHNLDTWIDICHVVKENEEYDPNKLDAKYKKFSSCYYEKGSTDGQELSDYMENENKYLRESGYDYFPAMIPRWEVTGEDSYPTSCPGLIAIGDIKQLQLVNKRKMQAIEKMVNPPMVADPELQKVRTSTLPGEISWARETDGKAKFRPAYQVDPRINELIANEQQLQERINRAFYVDLFLMLANTDRRQITAREVEERYEEKLLALGPVLEQTNQDLLDPLVENTFQRMLEQSLDANGQFIEGAIIPQPPEELSGVDLRVEYVSIMAQAQKLVGVSGVERFIKFVSDVATVKQDPTVYDKIDIDQTIDIYSDLTSVPPGIVRSDEAVLDIRNARAQQQQQQAQQEQLMNAAKGAKDLSGAKLDDDNALKRLLDQAQAGQLTPAA